MDLDRSLLEMIDEYISDALSVTGTRRVPRATQSHPIAHEPDLEPSDREPTDPFAEGDDLIDGMRPLPRERAPRSTIDLDDEITNIVRKPPEKA
jgi:hypothetical protein